MNCRLQEQKGFIIVIEAGLLGLYASAQIIIRALEAGLTHVEPENFHIQICHWIYFQHIFELAVAKKLQRQIHDTLKLTLRIYKDLKMGGTLTLPWSAVLVSFIPFVSYLKCGLLVCLFVCFVSLLEVFRDKLMRQLMKLVIWLRKGT